MTVEELIDVLADLPDKSLPCPMMLYVGSLLPHGGAWATIGEIRFDEDRVLFTLEAP